MNNEFDMFTIISALVNKYPLTLTKVRRVYSGVETDAYVWRLGDHSSKWEGFNTLEECVNDCLEAAIFIN